MAGSRVVVRLGVVVRALVLVADEEADGSTESHACLDTRLDLDGVGFIALQIKSKSVLEQLERVRTPAQEW